MSTNNQFDFIIIGAGLAGLQLAKAFSEDSFFTGKRIGIIEPYEKNTNDKTWCFWEIGEGKWDDILFHSWSSAKFKSLEKNIELEIEPYRYKMIRSIDFYEKIKAQLRNNSTFEWILDEIQSVNQSNCIGNKSEYSADFIFDSRINAAFSLDKKHINIKQHFKGWFIETNEDSFNPESFKMMDFSISYKNSCCFTYLLPTSSKCALVEFTFFTPELVEDHIYDDSLKSYIKEELKLESYKIKEVEKGVIPMSTFPFQEENKPNYLKIGTAGGWVKASSGYSFKSVEQKVSQVLENIKTNKALDWNLFSKRFQFYDRVFLRILEQENQLGNQLFIQLYEKNKADQIFKFLDEETNLSEEIKIINSFKKAPFLRSLKKEIIR